MVAKMKMAHPLRMAFNDEFRRPGVAELFLLRSGESVDIRAVMRDEYEELQIAHDELRFVGGTNRALYVLYVRFGGNVIEGRKF